MKKYSLDIIYLDLSLRDAYFMPVEYVEREREREREREGDREGER